MPQESLESARKYSSLRERCLDVSVLGGLLLAGWFTRFHSGSYSNVRIPAYAGLAIFFGVGLAKIVAKAGHRGKYTPWIYVAVILQFLGLGYAPSGQIPSEAAWKEGDKLLNIIAGYNGDVWISCHPWYSTMIGRRPTAQSMAISDILRAPCLPAEKERLKSSILQRLAEKSFDAIILDSEDEFPTDTTEMQNNYRLVDSNLTTIDFTPVTGARIRPQYLYIKKTGR